MAIRSVVKAVIPKKVFRKIEPAGHLTEAVLLNVLRGGSPAQGLKVIGVTGTNGKTTTSFMIHRMLVEAGYKAGLMTTVGYGVGRDIKPQVEHMTTVSVPQLIKRIRALKRQGIEWLVLETTSHALAQHRDWDIPYYVAVMTNVTHEHLDYHGNFENYLSAKLMLFKRANKNKKGLKTGVINADDPNVDKFVAAIQNPITYGIKKGDLRATGIKMTPAGNVFTAKIGGDKYQIKTELPGSFNVYNALAAISVGRVLGLTQKQIEAGIAALDAVEGRMNTVVAGQKFQVIVDYAHTPDSFEKLFRDLKPLTKGRLIVMFGSAGGQRDKLKRPVQGALAGKYADLVVLTEEDDRDTPGQEILDQIAAGAKRSGKVVDKDLFLVPDRHEAVKFTLGLAKDDDTVLLLGKGHEKTIERAGGDIPWDEVAEAKAALEKL